MGFSRPLNGRGIPLEMSAAEGGMTFAFGAAHVQNNHRLVNPPSVSPPLKCDFEWHRVQK